MFKELYTFFKNLRILKIYFVAVLIYSLPFISLFIFLLDQLFSIFHSQMVFWVVFLVGLFPCGFLGLILSAIGLYISNKKKLKLNKVIGIVGTVAGILWLVGGVLGYLLIYAVVS